MTHHIQRDGTNVAPARLTGISNDMVADAPSFEDLRGEVRRRLDGRHLRRGPDDELRRIAERAERHDVVLCSDEIHCGLVLDPAKRHVPIAALDPRDQPALIDHVISHAATVGVEALTRFYLLHIMVLPIVLVLSSAARMPLVVTYDDVLVFAGCGAVMPFQSR